MWSIISDTFEFIFYKNPKNHVLISPDWRFSPDFDPKQADVVPVFGAMFAERALPPRMRAFAVQTLGNLLSLDEAVAGMMERIDGMLPRLVAGLRDRSYPLLPAHCLQVYACVACLFVLSVCVPCLKSAVVMNAWFCFHNASKALFIYYECLCAC